MLTSTLVLSKDWLRGAAVDVNEALSRGRAISYLEVP